MVLESMVKRQLHLQYEHKLLNFFFFLIYMKCELNKQKCECPETNCERHGKCCECVAFYKARKELPQCF